VTCWDEESLDAPQRIARQVSDWSRKGSLRARMMEIQKRVLANVEWKYLDGGAVVPGPKYSRTHLCSHCEVSRCETLDAGGKE